MADEGFKYQLSSKVGDHMLNVRADDVGEFREKIDDLFGENSSTQVLAPFFVSTALGASTPPPAAEQPEPNALGTCPIDGGNLVRKNRKDGSGSFIGCGNFPSCSYIKN